MSNYNNKNSTEEEIMEVDKNININDFKNKIKLKLIFYQVKKLSTLFAQKNYHQQD